MDAHSHLAEKFKKPFETPTSGVMQTSERGSVVPEITMTVSDACKRAATHIPLLAVNPTRGTFPGGFPAGTGNINFMTVGREPFHYFSYTWQFWRGSRVVRHFHNGEMVSMYNPGYIGSNQNRSFGDGATFFFASKDDAVTKHAEGCHIPWRSSVQWIPMFQNGVSITQSFYRDVFYYQTYIPEEINLDGFFDAGETLTLEGGDDFMLLNPLPFFPLVYYPAYTPEPAPVTTAVHADKRPKSSLANRPPPVRRDRDE